MIPFHDGDTSTTFRAHTAKVLDEIKSLENEYVLKASVSELEQHFVDKLLINPLVLHVDQKYIIGQSGVRVDVSHDFRRAVFPGERAFVPGTRLDLAIPFEGDPILWKLQASTFTMSGYPDIDVRNGMIVISFQFPDDSASLERLRSDIDRAVACLEDAVRNLRRDVDGHNAGVAAKIRGAIQTKRALAQSVTGALSALGIPFKRASEAPTFTIPAVRRPNPSCLPPVSAGPYQPEPALAPEEFEYILHILYSMAVVIERSPSSFASIQEEAIRDHFLIQLNGHYEGGATGETFNAAGKTDILIRAGNRNVFIAECKFWRGPKAFTEAIDQLMSYLTWRDSKCALLIFNRNKDSSAVRDKMHEVMQARIEHRKTLLHTEAGDSRYVMIKGDDPGREIIIATQVYDTPG